MLQAPSSKPKRIVAGEDPQAQFRRAIREQLGIACEDLDISALYRPGITNNPDFSLGLFCLGLYERIKKLEAENARLRRTEKKKSRAKAVKRKTKATP